MKTLACRFALALLSMLVMQNASAQRVFNDCRDCPEMVVIPAGSFPMGGDRMFSNYVRLTELPQHRVQIRSFAIGKYEVTQEQWFAVMDNNPSANRGRQLPVENVSWDEVQEFIAKLNQKTGRRYRLPSEAEWEYAARAGTTAEWSHGNDESELGNYCLNNKREGYEEALRLIEEFKNEPWIQDVIDFAIKSWTKKGSRDDQMVAFTLQKEIDGFEELVLASKKANFNKKLFNACYSQWGVQFSMVWYCYGKDQ